MYFVYFKLCTYHHLIQRLSKVIRQSIDGVRPARPQYVFAPFVEAANWPNFPQMGRQGGVAMPRPTF